MQNELEVAIFSYNRGQYLKNCIESITKNLPEVKVTVFDDYSDDPYTVSYLKQLGDKVILGADGKTMRHGNLYKNMQMALDLSSQRFLLFLQDDIQVVRAITTQDINNIDAIFSDPDIAFLRPQFMKQGDGQRNIGLLTPSEKIRAYIPKDEYKKGTFGHSYCDVVLCDINTLKKRGWKFLEGERANQIQAHGMFKYMPFMADSFVFYCPEVPCYRDKKLFLASKLVQNKLEGNISAFKVFSEDKNNKFTHRNINIWPIAEDFLEPTNTGVVRPFVYQDYNKDKWLKILYKLERGLRGLYKMVRYIKLKLYAMFMFLTN